MMQRLRKTQEEIIIIMEIVIDSCQITFLQKITLLKTVLENLSGRIDGDGFL